MSVEAGRRQSDLPLGERVTILEADAVHYREESRRHEVDSRQFHQDMHRMIKALDDRTDLLVTRLTVAVAVVAILVSVFQIIAPLIQRSVGLPS